MLLEQVLGAVDSAVINFQQIVYAVNCSTFMVPVLEKAYTIAVEGKSNGSLSIVNCSYPLNPTTLLYESELFLSLAFPALTPVPTFANLSLELDPHNLYSAFAQTVGNLTADPEILHMVNFSSFSLIFPPGTDTPPTAAPSSSVNAASISSSNALSPQNEMIAIIVGSVVGGVLLIALCVCVITRSRRSAGPMEARQSDRYEANVIEV